MLIVKMGEKINKEFHFICKNCKVEWYADRQDVNFTPPFMEYDVYMDCTCCGETIYQSMIEKR